MANSTNLASALVGQAFIKNVSDSVTDVEDMLESPEAIDFFKKNETNEPALERYIVQKALERVCASIQQTMTTQLQPEQYDAAGAQKGPLLSIEKSREYLAAELFESHPDLSARFFSKKDAVASFVPSQVNVHFYTFPDASIVAIADNACLSTQKVLESAQNFSELAGKTDKANLLTLFEELKCDELMDLKHLSSQDVSEIGDALLFKLIKNVLKVPFVSAPLSGYDEYFEKLALKVANPDGSFKTGVAIKVDGVPVSSMSSLLSSFGLSTLPSQNTLQSTLALMAETADPKPLKRKLRA